LGTTKSDSFTTQIPPRTKDIYSEAITTKVREAIGSAIGKKIFDSSQSKVEREKLEAQAIETLKKQNWHYYAGEYWSPDWTKRYRTAQGATESIKK
jgi:hypothetical protein